MALQKARNAGSTVSKKKDKKPHLPITGWLKYRISEAKQNFQGQFELLRSMMDNGCGTESLHMDQVLQALTNLHAQIVYLSNEIYAVESMESSSLKKGNRRAKKR